jgi:outer membrane protein TolC
MLKLARRLRDLLLATLVVGSACGLAAADESAAAQPAAAAETADIPRAETIFPQLEPILVDALTQSPTMIQESLGRLAAGYDADSERSVLYPRAGGYASFRLQREDRLDADESSTGERTYFDFSVNQPFFHWGSIKAQAEIGRINHLIAERNFTEAYQLYANRVRDTYLSLVGLRVAQRNRALDLARTRAQLEVVRQQVAEGRVPAGTIAAVEAAIEGKVLAGDRADYALERLLRQFRDLVGKPGFALADVPETVPPVATVPETRSMPLRTEYVTRRGFEDHPSYFRALRNLEVDRLRLRITRNELKPKFNLNIGASQDMDNRTTNVEQQYMITTYYGGITMNWSIWDSKSSASRARAAQARIRRSEKNLEQLERDIIESIEAAEKEVGFSTRGLSIAERGYAGAESSYRALIDFQKEGRASQDEVDAALLAWRSAEYSVCESRRDYLRTVAAFLATIQADPLVDKLQRDGKIPR